MANSSNRGGSRPGAGRKKKNPDGTYEHAAFSAEQLKELTDSPHGSFPFLDIPDRNRIGETSKVAPFLDFCRPSIAGDS